MLARMWRKGNLLHCWWKCKLVQPLWKTVWKFLKKLKIELPNDPAFPLLGMYPKKTKTLFWKDICTPMFTAALFPVGKTWKQPKCPSVDEWIKKMWYICTIEYYSAIKRMKFCHLQQHGWTRGGIMPSEISQTEKDKYCMISPICGI